MCKKCVNKDNCCCRSYVSVVLFNLCSCFCFFFCASFFDNHLLQMVSKVATGSNITSNFGPIVCVHTREESERRTQSLNTLLSSVNSVLFDFKRNDLPLYYNLVLWVMYPLNVWKLFSWFGVCFVFLKALLEMCFCLKVSPFCGQDQSVFSLYQTRCMCRWMVVLMDTLTHRPAPHPSIQTNARTSLPFSEVFHV